MPDARRLLPILALALSLAAFPLGALASHDFADVPDSNIYHADISALAASGVTTGCGGGNYCPSAFVTREQMAAFMNRLGALAAGKTPVVNAAELDGLDSSQFARSDVPVTGHFNCPGVTMQPMDGGATYSNFDQARVITVGPVIFTCNIVLPDGAAVTAFRARVYDVSTLGGVGTCGLFRQTLSGNTITALASMPGSSLPEDGGEVLIEETTIATPVIENDLYMYRAECWMVDDGNDFRLRGVSVEYTVSGLPVI